MAVVRVSKSGKSVQFIDEAGNVFLTSMAFLRGYLYNEARWGKPLFLNRLPSQVNAKRFGYSPLYVDGELLPQEEPAPCADDGLRNANDYLSVKATKERSKKKVYSRDVVL